MTVQQTDVARRASFDAALSTVRFHFQPIVSAREGRLTGYEALARPEARFRGGAGGFVVRARRLGRAHALAAALLRACDGALSRLPGHLRLYMNVSRADLDHGILFALAPVASRVILEIDQQECIGMDPASVAEYRRAGFRFAADDLRGGRGALSAIAALEPEIYKLDRSLLAGLESEPMRQAAIRALLRLGGRNGADVICEGVERERERDLLLDLGADLMQGYLFGVARPLDRVRVGRGVAR